MRPGAFITLEGGEGAGKSTQIRLLAERLSASGIEVVTTREPGGSARAEDLRTLILSGAARPFGALAEALLFYAARSDHLDTLIRPALARGAWVLCDRFSDSTRAYQGAAGHVDRATLSALDRVVVGETQPDLTIVLDVPPQIGLKRARIRRGVSAGDRFETEGAAFHRALRKAFLEIASAEPERCVVVDGARPPEIVAQDIWLTVRERLLGEGSDGEPVSDMAEQPANEP